MVLKVRESVARPAFEQSERLRDVWGGLREILYGHPAPVARDGFEGSYS